MHTIVRAAVVALALTGSVAYAHIGKNPAKTTVVMTTSYAPIPTCPPSDPGGCGMGPSTK